MNKRVSQALTFVALAEAEDNKTPLPPKVVLEGARVYSIKKSGEAKKLHGNVTLSQGANVTLTQSEQNIQVASASGSADTNVFLKDGSRSMTGNLLPATDGTLNLGSLTQAWLRAYFAATDNVNSLFSRLNFYAKVPTTVANGVAWYAGYAYPTIEFYIESPIGTRYPAFLISNVGGQLIITDINAATPPVTHEVLKIQVGSMIYCDATFAAETDNAHDLGHDTGSGRWHNLFLGGTAYVDTVSEVTAATGVTIDGVKLKDSEPYCDVINEKTAATGVTIDGVKLKDSQPYCDVINEKTAATGVTVDSLLLKDGEVDLATLKNIIFRGDNDATYGTIALRRNQNLDYLYLYNNYPTNTTYGNLVLQGLACASIDSTSNATRCKTNTNSDAYFIFTTWTTTWNDILWMNQNKIGLNNDNFFKVGADSDGSLPSASSAYRGYMIRTEGAAGVADKLYCCMKDAADAYSWVQVASG